MYSDFWSDGNDDTYNVYDAYQLLNSAGLIIKKCPSEQQAHDYLQKTVEYNKQQGIKAINLGLIRYSKSKRHKLALSMINNNGVIEHRDLSDSLENRLDDLMSNVGKPDDLINYILAELERELGLSRLFIDKGDKIDILSSEDRLRIQP